MRTNFPHPNRCAVSALVVAAGLSLAACGGSSKSSTNSSSTTTGNTGSTSPTVPSSITTAAPPVVTGSGVKAFCAEARNLINFNANTGQPKDIQKAMPAINQLIVLAPPEIKAQVTQIASIFQTVANGGKLTATNVPKSLQKDNSDYKAFVQKNCPA